MSNIENLITTEELALIENTPISKGLENNIERRNKRFVYQELFNKALENVINDLKEDEFIEEYIIGRNYRADITRIMLAGVTVITPGPMAYVAHPLMDWSAKAVLIKTNKRLLLMETAQYYKFLKYYEVESSVTVYTEKRVIQLEVFDSTGNQILVECPKETKNYILDKLQENNISFIESKNKVKCKERDSYNKEVTAIWTIVIAALIFLALKMFVFKAY